MAQQNPIAIVRRFINIRDELLRAVEKERALGPVEVDETLYITAALLTVADRNGNG